MWVPLLSVSLWMSCLLVCAGTPGAYVTHDPQAMNRPLPGNLETRQEPFFLFVLTRAAVRCGEGGWGCASTCLVPKFCPSYFPMAELYARFRAEVERQYGGGDAATQDAARAWMKEFVPSQVRSEPRDSVTAPVAKP